MSIILQHIGAWLVATGIAILTIFSDKIVARIKLHVNRADLLTKYFEELAVDLSTYIFWVEVFHERYQRGWATDPEDMGSIGGEINGAVTTLRKKEYVYRAWVRKYWRSNEAHLVVRVLASVKAVDDAVHDLNNDPGDEAEKTVRLGRQLQLLRKHADELLTQ